MQHLYTAIAKHPECHSVELKDIDECELEDLLHPGIVTMICSVLIDDWKTLSNLSICIKQSIERFDEVMCDLGICQYGPCSRPQASIISVAQRSNIILTKAIGAREWCATPENATHTRSKYLIGPCKR